jgi:DNA repair exonuclease SbcCD ATPase subunit
MPILNHLEQAVKVAQNSPLQQPDRSEEVRLNGLLEQAREHLKQAIVEDITTHEAEQKEARKLQRELDETRKELDDLEKKKAKGRDLLSQIAVLEKNICFNCLQPWRQAVEQKQWLEAEMASIANLLEERQLEAVPARIKRLEEAVQTAWKHTPNPDIKRLEGIECQLMHQCADIEQYNHYLLMTSQSEHDAKVAEAKAALESTRSSALKAAQDHQGNATERLTDSKDEVEALQNTLRNAYSELQACKSEANSVYMKNASIRQRAEANVRAVQEAEKRLEGARKRAGEYQGKLTAEKDFLLLVGPQGFLGAIFDEVLWEISDETNRILGSIPNTSHVTISFRSETTTQKGRINKEITPVCKINGHETPVKAGCSGGMFSVIELAVDLAVAAVVSRRTGIVPSWMILDEAFEGLGVVEKEGCLEILRTCASDRLILVVDHASEVKSMFSQSIDIEYENGYSRLRCAIS